MATAAPPLPPEVEQQQDPKQAQSVFAQQGLPQAQPGMENVKALAAKLQGLEKQIMEIRDLGDQVNPDFKAFLVPVLNGLVTYQKALQKMTQESGMAMGSPVAPQQPPMNPASGPPDPNAA